MMVASRVLLPLSTHAGPREPQVVLTLRGITQRVTKLQRLVFLPPYDSLTVLDIVFRPKNPKSTFEETCLRASALFPDKVPVGSEQDAWHLVGFPARMPASAFREDVPEDNLPSFPILYAGDVALIRVAAPESRGEGTTIVRIKEAYAHFICVVLMDVPGPSRSPLPGSF